MASDKRRTKGVAPISPPDYYQELGLSRQASPEEIRRTHRSLAWLLHPDRCQDEEMRRVAEAQLKRLNGIVAVLLDPEQRRRYDQSLQHTGDLWPRKIRAFRSRLAKLTAGWPHRRIWASGVFVLLGLLTWMVVAKPSRTVHPMTSATPRPQRSLAESKSASAQQGAARVVSPLPSAPQRAVDSKKAAELAPAEPEAVDAATPAEHTKSEPLASRAESAGEQPLPPRLSVAERPPSMLGPAPSVTLPANSARTYSGWWLLAPGTTAEVPPELYPPIYVEMFIEQKGALLRGRYKGRYHVSDRAISPEVSFTFEGPAEGDEPELTWRGGQGAEGRLRLRWVGENSMEVRWWTTKFGADPGLSSGIATLIRVEERR